MAPAGDPAARACVLPQRCAPRSRCCCRPIKVLKAAVSFFFEVRGILRAGKSGEPSQSAALKHWGVARVRF